MTVRSKRNTLRFAAVAAVLAVATLAVLWLSPGSGSRTAEAAEEKPAPTATEDGAKAAIPVRVATAERGEIASYISATANLVAEDDVRVLAEAEGRVTRLEVEEGDRVAAKAVLAVLDRDAAEIALRKARLRAANAGMAFERARNTLEQGLISTEEFDRLRLEHEVAQQEVAEAEWKLERTVIRAPFAGRITERLITVGNHVRPGDPLFGLADFDPLVARIYLPESDVLHLEVGRPVRITLAADSSMRFSGAIRQISPVVDTATGTVKVTVEATSPPAGVRPGAFVTVDVVRERREAAVLLPRESVIRELRSAHVFVARDGKAERRPVTLGLEEGERIEALDGVEPGDEIIVAGQGGLKPGSSIKVL